MDKRIKNNQFSKINSYIEEIKNDKKLHNFCLNENITLGEYYSQQKFFDKLTTNNDNELLINILHSKYRVPILRYPYSVVKIFDCSKITSYVQEGYFIYLDYRGKKFIALNNTNNLTKLAAEYSNIKIKLVKSREFYLFLEATFSHLNTLHSKYLLETLLPYPTARVINYKKVVTGFFILFYIGLFKLINLFHLANHASYFLQHFLKIYLFRHSLTTPDLSTIYNPPDAYLPIYTILVPLYKELGKLKAIIEAINNLNYPKFLLDVKIIVEDDDKLLIKELSLINLPSYIQVIKVPFSLPRTKPKALNYAMQYCRGKYLVVYDAEDKPEADQLLKALASFNSLPDEYACLQAKLNFYNKDENLLTKLLSIEYSIWFEYILKGLSILGLPVTLGGTSNHFKTDILRKVGNWDAYNVTEDAELGIRLYLQGYKVGMIDSYTLEEAPITLGNWLNQRARWSKGFIQTFLVLLQIPRDYNKLTYWQTTTVYIFIGVSSYSFFCLPWLFVTIIKPSKLISYLALLNVSIGLAYLYSSAGYILAQFRKGGKKLSASDILALAIWPVYFLLHAIASYKAVWELLFTPFEWNKTDHDLSSFK